MQDGLTRLHGTADATERAIRVFTICLAELEWAVARTDAALRVRRPHGGRAHGAQG
jgi:hypothetical protein